MSVLIWLIPFLYMEEYITSLTHGSYLFHWQEQAKIAKLGLEMKLITSEMEAEADKWAEPDNAVVRRAKNMAAMAFSMYLFTRGEGRLHTTHDLFLQAEFFAEEGNKLYRTVKDFASRVSWVWLYTYSCSIFVLVVLCVCLLACMCACGQVGTCVYVYVCVCMHECACVCVFVCTYMFVCVHVCVFSVLTKSGHFFCLNCILMTWRFATHYRI